MSKLKILKIIILIIMFIILFRLFDIQILHNNYYIEKKNRLTQMIVEGGTAPRGRIYDRNGILIVDNKPNKVICYKKKDSISKNEELDMIKYLSSLIDIDTKKLTIKMLKDYFLIINNKINLLTEEEKKLYKDRILTLDDINKLKYSRITEEDISRINREEAYIYYLMNNGYSYQDKVIKNENVTDYEYAIVSENLDKLKGFKVKLDWDRIYIYDNLLKGILGRVGNIPLENQKEYLDKGYSNNDVVGISYLEYQYDEYLKGIKNKYLINKNGNYNLIEEGKKGNDLILTIDINLQKNLEDILVRSLKESKNEPNTRYLNKSFAIISNPLTGEILAMSGKQIINNDIYDYTHGIVTSSYVIGSTVKGASQIVGYNTGALKIGEVRNDGCIKIKSTTAKCSWKYLGNINDLTALKYSSNTYQFRTAIKVGGGSYIYNSPLKINNNAFEIYRNTFNEFGLGVKTEIDLPNEKLGYKGITKNSNLLLNFSIGQYDTYTPIELSQYINTIANNGIRVKPFLVKKIVSNDNKTLLEQTRSELNKVNTEMKYIERVKEGFRQVLEPYGTGYNYINTLYKPAGKTGTSQSFLDTNNDSKIDIETISTSFIGYAPYDNPKFSIAVITPDVSDYSDGKYVSTITKTIVRRISDAYFSRY